MVEKEWMHSIPRDLWKKLTVGEAFSYDGPNVKKEGENTFRNKWNAMLGTILGIKE